MKSAAICIDARMIQSSGIGTYLQGLLSGLRTRIRPDFSFSLLGNPELLPKGPWSIRAASAPIYSIREQVEIPWAVRRQKFSLLHSPHYNMPWMTASKTVVTVHDLIHLKFPQYWPSRAARAYAQFFFHRVIPKARAILTVSENTKRDLVQMLSIAPERVTVTYPAVSHEQFQKALAGPTPEFKRLDLPRDYLLFVGNLKEFKNVERLVESYRRLLSIKKDSPALVMVGRNFIPGFEREIAKTSAIRWIGEAPRELLPLLYRNALAFLFPSLYEGFGLPPLEAMASGTPVLCSNRASLPEVVGDAALLVNPEDTEELTAAMGRLIDDGALRKELSARGLKRAALFSWNKMADLTLQVYEQCLV